MLDAIPKDLRSDARFTRLLNRAEMAEAEALRSEVRPLSAYGSIVQHGRVGPGASGVLKAISVDLNTRSRPRHQ